MKIRQLILSAFTFCIINGSRGQHHIFQSYSMNDGLTNNAIRKIYQDSQGFIWVCTWEGLNKLEGIKITPFATSNGLPHSMVNDIYEISPGQMTVLSVISGTGD
jgi:ligand-binding sensor domain-containing protein